MFGIRICLWCLSHLPRTALETWAAWAETTINPNRPSVLFRTFESSHWRNVA
ncbi:hypothetical protein SLEP1_g17508 [Rubroshorea leprosula]|uniref:Uncharacterized protein n=1 Tax=Rubroshorea leprosula TaxID=152421 RepID=A0AAV5J3L1_9ROSI|nr:hypothetical protein SLEP1_g17508 [Rubroshorea leprosula]